MLAVARRRTVDPVQGRRDLQDLAPRLEKVLFEHCRGITRVEHESRPSALALLSRYHGKTRCDMQTVRCRSGDNVKAHADLEDLNTAKRPAFAPGSKWRCRVQ